jgi:hypothetical protein
MDASPIWCEFSSFPSQANLKTMTIFANGCFTDAGKQKSFQILACAIYQVKKQPPSE